MRPCASLAVALTLVVAGCGKPTSEVKSTITATPPAGLQPAPNPDIAPIGPIFPLDGNWRARSNRHGYALRYSFKKDGTFEQVQSQPAARGITTTSLFGHFTLKDHDLTLSVDSLKMTSTDLLQNSMLKQRSQGVKAARSSAPLRALLQWKDASHLLMLVSIPSARGVPGTQNGIELSKE